MAVIVQHSLVCADSMHPCFHVQGDIHHRILCRAREKAGLHLQGTLASKTSHKVAAVQCRDGSWSGIHELRLEVL